MKKRMRFSSAISRQSRAMAQPLRNSQRRFFVQFVPFSIGKTGSVPLTRFRQLTQIPPTRLSAPLKDLKRAVKDTRSIIGFQVSDLQKSKICQARKERREVLFASKKTGGNHKPPKYTIKSLVRCSK